MSFPGETKGLWTQVPTMEDNENSGGVLMGLWRGSNGALKGGLAGLWRGFNGALEGQA